MTKVLQKGTEASIAMYVRVYGRPCSIYLPLKTGIYSGSLDDIDYNDEPDRIDMLFIPNLFNKMSRFPSLANYDLLGRSEYYAIVPIDYKLPLNTKVVLTSPKLGVVRFVIRDNDLASTYEGAVYKRLNLEPMYDTSQDNDGLAALRLSQGPAGVETGGVDESIVSSNSDNNQYQYYNPNGSRDYND